GGQGAVGYAYPYVGKIRWYTPGDPAAWTMCGRISLFHTGVTAVRQSSQAWLCQTSSDAISWTVAYFGSPITASKRRARMWPGIRRHKGNRSLLYASLNCPSNSAGTDIRPTRRTGAISAWAVSAGTSCG